MEEDGDEYPRSPFWLQSTSNLRRADRYRRRVSSLFFNLGSLVLLLLLAAILFLGFFIPSVVKHTSQNIKPNVVKRSWDWINLVLVLFALAFGFLSRNRNNEDRSFDGYQRTGSSLSSGTLKSNPATPHQQWYDFSDQAVFQTSGGNVGLRRHRNSSSYPDLRELSPEITGGDPWRFYDDTRVDSYRVMSSDHYYGRRRSWKDLNRQDSVTKDVHIDPFVNRPKEVSFAPPPEQPPPQPSPSETPAPPPAVKKKSKRTYQSLGLDQEMVKAAKGHASSETKKIVTEELEDLPLPSSPPPMMASIQEMEQRSGATERKRGGGTVTKDFLASFYSKKKKKRQRQRSVDNLDSLLHHPEPPPLRFQLPPPSPPPPPPPLPPPPSVFHNLFTSKKDKRKKIPHSTPAFRTPPPPPPPPPLAARTSKPMIIRKAPIASNKPPMPARVHNFNYIDEGSSGGESPMRRIPPPPPPPPFRMPDLKYVVEGDYARLLRTDSSRSGSPDIDEVESPSSDRNLESGGDVALFCPSPDVDTKADSFIAKFRAGLKLEKVNSFNQKQGVRMSNLGPSSGGPGPL